MHLDTEAFPRDRERVSSSRDVDFKNFYDLFGNSNMDSI